MRETWGRSLGWDDPLEEGMAIHPSILAWRITMVRGVWRATAHGIIQAIILECVAIPFSKESSQPRDQTQDSRIAGRYCQLSPKERPRIQDCVASPADLPNPGI